MILMIESEKNLLAQGKKTNMNLSFCNIRLNLVRQAAGIFSLQIFQFGKTRRVVFINQNIIYKQIYRQQRSLHIEALKNTHWIELNICCGIRNCSNFFVQVMRALVELDFEGSLILFKQRGRGLDRHETSCDTQSHHLLLQWCLAICSERLTFQKTILQISNLLFRGLERKTFNLFFGALTIASFMQ